MVRGPYYDKNGVKRGAWSKEEDERLRAFVERYGHSNWRELPKLAGLSRCGKSCRRRWVNHLKPNVKRGHYTKEEDLIIIKLHEQHGNKWSLIAKKLPGRTDNDIKNQWHSRLKKLFQRNDHEMKSDFQMNPSDTSEGEITQYTESENSIPSGAPSYNILENWQPTYTETYGECSEIASWGTFQIFSNFWTEPFIVENTQSLDNYGANGVYMDQYVSDLWDDTAELCDVMQELPNDPK